MQPIANITYIHTFVEEFQQFNEKKKKRSLKTKLKSKNIY